jgi:hypothetical protein
MGGEALHLYASSLGISKWKLYVCHSICGLCKTSQYNPMMIGFVENEMTLKTILLICDAMVISNALVSCIISLVKKL